MHPSAGIPALNEDLADRIMSSARFCMLPALTSDPSTLALAPVLRVSNCFLCVLCAFV